MVDHGEEAGSSDWDLGIERGRVMRSAAQCSD